MKHIFAVYVALVTFSPSAVLGSDAGRLKLQQGHRDHQAAQERKYKQQQQRSKAGSPVAPVRAPAGATVATKEFHPSGRVFLWSKTVSRYCRPKGLLAPVPVPLPPPLGPTPGGELYFADNVKPPPGYTFQPDSHAVKFDYKKKKASLQVVVISKYYFRCEARCSSTRTSDAYVSGRCRMNGVYSGGTK